jgi:type I restriction enzyme M protein
MQQAQHGQIVSFIWRIADDVLRDVFVRGKYRDVILPMTVIRRLDAVLEPTKANVLERRQWAEDNGIRDPDQILKGEGAENIAHGSTLAGDAFPNLEFDFMLSNPPYGKGWKADFDRLGGKEGMKDPRFVIDFDGDPEYSLVTRTSDGQLMFLANKLAKMKTTGQGSRIAEVHNGSSLFTGDAGQGESNIRRWIFESDWLEAIIALPNNMFYNTGIATYIWVISNRKTEQRRGRVQLIDATKRFTLLRKNLGSKNAELGHSNIVSILDEFIRFEETATSKIFPNAAFGYWKVTIDRPLKLRVDIPERTSVDRAITGIAPTNVSEPVDGDPVSILVGGHPAGSAPTNDANTFSPVIPSEVEGSLPDGAPVGVDPVSTRVGDEPVSDNPAFDALPEPIRTAIHAVAADLGTHTIDDWSVFSTAFERIAKTQGVKLTAATRKAVQNAIATRDDSAQPIVKKRTYDVVEYEPDPELRDTEQISLLEADGIDGFFVREVLPHVPDAWIVPGSAKIGYEVSFTRYFYKPKHLRTLAEIAADIRDLEAETEGLLDQILVATT